jgi:4-amino-4-deoxy-L-arabinose transferase-like glycosyltransferase
VTDYLGGPARPVGRTSAWHPPAWHPSAWHSNPGHALLFAAILAVGVGLRFYRITELPPALYPDEAFYGTDTLRSMASGVWRVFYPLNNGHEGLIVWAHAPFILLFGTTPWVLRLQPAVLGSLTLIAIYLLALEFARGFMATGRDGARRMALLAMLFLATNSWHLHLSRLGFRAVHVPLFAALAVWALLRGRRLNSAWAYGVSGVMTALAIYTYPNGRFVPFIPFGMFALDLLISRLRLRGFAIFLACFVIVFLPLGIYYIGHLQEFAARYDQVGFTAAASPARELLRSFYRTVQSPFFFGDALWRHNVSGGPFQYPLVALACFLGLLLAAVSVAHRLRLIDARTAAATMRPYGAAVLLLFLGVMSVPAILTTEGIPHALRSGGMLPPLIVAAAVAAEIAIAWAVRMATEAWARAMVAAAVAFVAMLLVQSVTYEYFSLWAGNPKSRLAFYPDMTELALQIDRLGDDIPKYVVTDRAGVPGDLHWLVQPIVFITNTASAAQQQQRNIHYVTVSELRTHGVANERAIYFLIDEAAPARDWLQQQAPAAEIRMPAHSWQEMQDLSH